VRAKEEGHVPRTPTIAIVTGFDPIVGQLRCACGAEVNPCALRRRPDGTAFLTCPACHVLLAEIVADIASTDPDYEDQ
jgi:hypothetical protein